MSRRRLGWVLALSLSAAVHFALASWLARREPPPFGGTVEAIEIEIIQAPPPAPTATASSNERQTAPAAPTAIARHRVVRATAPAAAPAVAVAAPTIEPPSAPTAKVPSAPAASDLPRAAPRLDLGPRPTFEGSVAVAPPESDGTKVSSAPEERKPQQLINENEGRRRVDVGMVDPYFAKLGKALIDSWKAEEHVTISGLKGLVAQTEENNRLFMGAWQQNAKRYAKAGSPLDFDVATPTVIERTGGTNTLAARAAYERQLADQYHARKRALVRVVQGRNGVLRSVTLVEGSTEPAIDRAAIADVRAAAAKLPPPPQEGLGIKEPIVSIWEFELIISISPPVPSISFEFDEALAFLDVRLPLDRRVYKKVKLISVE